MGALSVDCIIKVGKCLLLAFGSNSKLCFMTLLSTETACNKREEHFFI